MQANNEGQGQQNNQSGGQQQKPGLSWSQPQSGGQNQRPPMQQKEIPKAPLFMNAPPQKNTESKTGRIIAGVIVVALLAIWGIVAVRSKGSQNTIVADTASSTTETADSSGTSIPSTTDTSATATTLNNTTVSSGSASFTVASPQDAGVQVAISNISVSVPTWIVIYENKNGQPGNALGAGLFFAGNTAGSVDLLRGTVSGQSYLAGEATDDGDHIFSLQNDQQVRDTNGNPIWVQFQTR